MPIKISKPTRLEKTGVTETELFAWKNELMNYLRQHENINIFRKGGWYDTWKPAELYEDRIETKVEADKGNLEVRQSDLNNIITVIAGCCHRDHYLLIVNQSTSFQWIWDQLTTIYQHKHQGKEFFTLSNLEYSPETDSPLSFYTSYRARILENMKPAGTTIKWQNTSIQATTNKIDSVS